MPATYSKLLLAMLATLSLGLFLPAARAQERGPSKDHPPELRKLYALLIIDTNADLGDSVDLDSRHVQAILRHGIPKERCEITVMSGKDVTPEKILGYYHNLKAGSSDALFFFYAGHGATDVDKGHFLYLQKGKGGNLFRSDLREAMQKKGTGLTVLITDCCSDPIKLNKKPRAILERGHPAEINPTQRCLFFQHRGLVDVTASTDNSANGDDFQGGLFTYHFYDLVENGKFDKLDTNGDGFLSWSEFFPRLQKDTQEGFVHFAAVARDSGEKVDQKDQLPRAFKLPDDGMPVAKEGPGKPIVVRNATSAAIPYEFRWAGSDTWEKGSIPANDSKAFTPPAGATTLEVKFDGGKVRTLEQGKTYSFGETKKN